MPGEKTTLEIALGAVATIVSALGVSGYIKKVAADSVAKIVGPILEPLVVDRRPDFLEDLRQMDQTSAQILEDRLLHPRAPFTRARLVQLLTKIHCNPQLGRQASLTWLAQMPEDRFYGEMEILHHNTIFEWISNVNIIDGKIDSHDLRKLEEIMKDILAASGHAARATGRVADSFLGGIAPIIGAGADLLEDLARKLKEGK